MKASEMMTHRFASPGVLKRDTIHKGVTMAEWEHFFTRGFHHTLAELAEKRKAYLLRNQNDLPVASSPPSS